MPALRNPLPWLAPVYGGRVGGGSLGKAASGLITNVGGPVVFGTGVMKLFSIGAVTESGPNVTVWISKRLCPAIVNVTAWPALTVVVAGNIALIVSLGPVRPTSTCPTGTGTFALALASLTIAAISRLAAAAS